MATGQGGAEIVEDGSPALTCNHEAPIAFHGAQDPCSGEMTQACGTNGGLETCIALEPRCARNGTGISAPGGSAVRRLMVQECERLQGMPDNHTRIPWRKKAAEDCPDGPRYKAIGNSMAVPCMLWIGERIQMVEDMINGED